MSRSRPVASERASLLAGSMRITKFGHACVRVESGSTTVVVDPGGWSEREAVDGASAVLVTHEHPDHLDPDNLRATDTPVYTIGAVAKQIAEQAPDVAERVTVIKPGDELDLGIPVTVVGEKHAVIHPELQHFDNSGYLLEVEGRRIFHPGDAFIATKFTAALLMRIPGAPSSCSSRTIAARSTGRPTTRPMKTVRRDQSISPSDRSKIRRLEAR